LRKRADLFLGFEEKLFIMKAPVLIKYGRINYQEVDLPKTNDNSALVKVAYASICGSDEHVFCGDFHPRTRLPLVQGHEFAGTIVNIGKNVKNFRIGDRVAVDPIMWCGKCAACEKGHYQACKSLKLLGIDENGGFSEYVAARDFMLHKVPDNVSDRHASLVEVFSIGFHACNRSAIQKGDSAAIFGTGKIGQAILQAVMTRTDGDILTVDIVDKRLEIAEQVNPKVKAINSKKQNPVKAIMDNTGGRGVDIAFEVVGHAKPIQDQPHPLRQCIQSIRQGGTVCVLGLSDNPAPLVMRELIFKEAKIVASRVTAGEFEEAIDQLSQGKLKPDPLITGELPASRIQQGFEQLSAAPEKDLKILIKPGV
jgi:threonine dehydrogenase-like Zn-dependent dehydrogenase